MRRTTPDLVGSRKTIYTYVSFGLLALTIGYVLWTNYVVFIGGNLPLTPISLGSGSTGAGLTMLFVGDLIAVLVLWFVIDGVILSLLHMILRAGNPQPSATAPAQGQQWQGQGQQGQAQAQQQWQGQQWQGPNQWWPQPSQQQWQPTSAQPQGQQPQGQQPQEQQQWQAQAWPPTSPSGTPVPPAPRDGSAQATLVAPNAMPANPTAGNPTAGNPTAGNQGSSTTLGVNDAAPIHRRWAPPPRR